MRAARRVADQLPRPVVRDVPGPGHRHDETVHTPTPTHGLSPRRTPGKDGDQRKHGSDNTTTVHKRHTELPEEAEKLQRRAPSNDPHHRRVTPTPPPRPPTNVERILKG
ncbi:hypothetical protein GCM10010329_48650 [Streptomyces spiroverticillatus]|uniref:Uncharacterized protein n=1 Tax=Streptomyces finlayi TaxID=67296 RepID=A0A918X135_9ACTN|nr:hypothetical protein GCM10010329_48650 [Streptomyces spiroverticillatus]GHD02709.1 hypothetical protein GCM10010334_49600 [Streptomyces finlayi]